jgi:hypothetical protein
VRLFRTSRKGWFSAWVRAAAALFAFLVAGEHGFASLHQALTAHEVCAEHGELVHADSLHSASVPRGVVPAVDVAAEVEAEHHHCGAVPAAPTRAPVVSAATECFAALPAVVPTSASPLAMVPAADVLAFAPKQSPPAS